MAKTPQQRSFLAAVHRCHFSNWMPSTVVSLACDPNSDLLAVGRGNGDIEICKINESWRVEKNISGHADVPVLSLEWFQDPDGANGSISLRLIGASMDGSLFEVDMTTLELKNVQDSFGGTIWSMAIAQKSKQVAIGCEDGAVRIFSLEDGDIQYVRSIPTLQQRILSLVWDEARNLLYTGGSDGTIHFFDMKAGHSKARLTLESFGGNPTHVWSMVTLAHGNLLASGDSLGQVKIWDVETGTLLQQLNTHTADILCLVASAGDKEVLFASGVDSKVVCIGPVNKVGKHENKAKANAQWAIVDSHRPHTHDVKALALCAKGNKPVLVSGGIDTKLCVYSVGGFGQTRPKRIWPFPYQSIVSVATLPSSQKLVLVQHAQRLDLWQLTQNKDACLPDLLTMTDGATISGYSEHELWGQIDVEGTIAWNLRCSALSPTGDFVAYSSPQGTEILRIDHANTSLSKARKIPKICSRSAHRLLFSPDGQRLVIVTVNGDLQVLNLSNPRKPNLDHVLDSNEPDSPVSNIAFSSDGQWLACSHASGSVYLFNMDTLQVYWKLPTFESPPTALAFHCHYATLVVACASNKFYLFDVEERRLAEWSRDCGDTFPKELLGRPEPITGITFNPARPSELVLYAHGFFCHVDLKFPVPKKARVYPPRHVSLQDNKLSKTSEPNRKRHRRSDSESDADKSIGKNGDNFVICLKYKPIIYLGFHGNDELLVLENPW
eukprot:CAMPEP_0117825856 /NCGR_PEP_ID=MMETSP0949-20121206/5727_1 /TAXON_ID=44440 /ORGANISM="Chattonella subsalsa, Strain CCMP2191" /LENGTH=721 /DNA_ID=CAMNT_0005665911 /DNA_START=34 /DNA_END=2196 /DNA_ORIENTATION=+